jgi:hypothetical protein
MCLEEISLDLGGKGTRNSIGMLGIISEQTLDINEELCLCFIDWQKTFDHVN